MFLVEVKATKEAKFYLRSHVKKQLDVMIDVAKRFNVGALLAIKYKRRRWEVEEL